MWAITYAFSRLSGSFYFWRQNLNGNIWSPASGTHPGFGSSQGSPSKDSKLQLHLVPPLVFLQLWLWIPTVVSTSGVWQFAVNSCLTYGIPEGGFLCFASVASSRVVVAMILCFSGRPNLFPGLPQLCCTSPLRVSSWQSTPLTPAVGTPKFETQHPAPTCCRHASCILAGKCSLAVISVVNSLHFVFQAPVVMFSDDVLKLLPNVPSQDKMSKCLEIFPFSWLGHRSLSQNPLSPFFFFFNLYLFSTSFWGDWLAFWKSGIFCKGSEGVL